MFKNLFPKLYHTDHERNKSQSRGNSSDNSENGNFCPRASLRRRHSLPGHPFEEGREGQDTNEYSEASINPFESPVIKRSKSLSFNISRRPSIARFARRIPKNVRFHEQVNNKDQKSSLNIENEPSPLKSATSEYSDDDISYASDTSNIRLDSVQNYRLYENDAQRVYSEDLDEDTLSYSCSAQVYPNGAGKLEPEVNTCSESLMKFAAKASKPAGSGKDNKLDSGSDEIAQGSFAEALERGDVRLLLQENEVNDENYQPGSTSSKYSVSEATAPHQIDVNRPVPSTCDFDKLCGVKEETFEQKFVKADPNEGKCFHNKLENTFSLPRLKDSVRQLPENKVSLEQQIASKPEWYDTTASTNQPKCKVRKDFKEKSDETVVSSTATSKPIKNTPESPEPFIKIEKKDPTLELKLASDVNKVNNIQSNVDLQSASLGQRPLEYEKSAKDELRDMHSEMSELRETNKNLVSKNDSLSNVLQDLTQHIKTLQQEKVELEKENERLSQYSLIRFEFLSELLKLSFHYLQPKIHEESRRYFRELFSMFESDSLDPTKEVTVMSKMISFIVKSISDLVNTYSKNEELLEREIENRNENYYNMLQKLSTMMEIKVSQVEFRGTN